LLLLETSRLKQRGGVTATTFAQAVVCFSHVSLNHNVILCHSMPFQAIPGNAMQCHAILSIPVELLLLNTRVDVQLIMPRAFEINTLIN